MAKSQMVANHIKSRLITGTSIIWGLAFFAIIIALIEYLSTGHFPGLLMIGLLVGICVTSLVMFIFFLPVIQSLETLEAWINGAAQGNVEQSISLSSRNNLMGPIFRACNALAVRLKVDNNQRVQFMERLTHDMRSSLASIQGYAEVLVDYHVGVEGASLQTYGKIIVSQTNRLAKMIEDALTSTCISGNQLRLELEPVRPATLLAALIDEARQRDVREIKYLDELGDILINGDTFRLREMLGKLIDNALSLSTSYISIHALVEKDQAGNWVKINVEDHGNGLTESEINVLFHPFEQAKDRKTSPIFLGGLSFYIIQAIVEGHRGTLTVKSQPGQGTTYIILLPVQKAKE